MKKISNEQLVDLIVDNIEFSSREKAEKFLKGIESFYNIDNRKYHNWNHILHGFNLFKDYYSNDKIPKELIIAWLFHDCIYFSNLKNSEDMSSDLMYSYIKHTDNELYTNLENELFLAKKFILATKTHKYNENDINTTLSLFLDVDMSYLSENFNDFLCCRDKIREEYNVFSDLEFYQGSINFCNNLLNQEKIFNNIFFKDKENICRDNLRKYVSMLEKKINYE